MNKAFLHIATVALCMAAFSCKKDDVSINKEDAVERDTSLFLYRAAYVSHTPTALTYSADILVFNGLDCEQNYTGMEFSDSSYFSDQNLSTSSTAVFNTTPFSEYSTVLAVDVSEGQSFEAEFVGFYLRRFFEIADSLPNRNVAISTFASNQNLDTRFHTENPGNIYGNSPDYNTAELFRAMDAASESGTTISATYIKGRLFDIVDSIVASPFASGDLSITLILGYSEVDLSSEIDVDQIVAHALSNNVRINLISPRHQGGLHRVCLETGGFVCTELFDGQSSPIEGPSAFSPVQTGLQNLDAMLSAGITSHRSLITTAFTGPGSWTSGDVVFTRFKYNGRTIEVSFKIP